LHDWLFVQHHCRSDGWEKVDFERSASLLAEAMKTQMKKADGEESTVVFAVYQAVRSPVAKKLWDQGTCLPPPSAAPPAGPEGVAMQPIRVFVIDADK